MTKHRFEPRPAAFLAIRPEALAYEHDEPRKQPFELRDGVALVRIEGPLTHHAGWWCDSYDEIKGRVSAALDARPRALMLVIDSPGGDVSGCFETSSEIRQMAAAAGVPVSTYVDGMAASAGYALACCGSTIYTPQTAILGSIGVISGLVDMTEALTSWGVRVRLVTSGARKADGHPYQPITDDAVSALQTMIDTLAGLFFQHVAESRSHAGLSIESIRALQAGIVLGADAKRAGLADEVVATLDEALALVASRSSAAPAPAPAARPRSGAATKTQRAAQRSASCDTHNHARSAGREMKTMPPITKPRAEDSKPAEDEKNQDTSAAVEECDLAKLREAMAMPDQPAQEVVDAAAEKIAGMAQGEDAEKAEAKRQVAQLSTSLDAIRAQVAEQSKELEALRPLAAKEREREREAAIDAEIAKRKMNVAAPQRAAFSALAAKHGTEAALAAIAAAHVPPGGTIGGSPSAESTSAKDPAAVTPKTDGARQREAIEARATELAAKPEHAGKTARHVLVSIATRQLRTERPDLFPAD